MVLLFWFVSIVNNIDWFSNVKSILYFRVKTHVVVLTTGWVMGDGPYASSISGGARVPHAMVAALFLRRVGQQDQEPCDLWSFLLPQWAGSAQMEGWEPDPATHLQVGGIRSHPAGLPCT